MSYNGSGTFLINTAGQPVVSGTVISSTAFNALTADLATGLSTAITKDGQTTVTANIPMGTYKFTGLGAGTAATDSANLSQVQSTVTKLLASVSGADTITAVASPTLGAYAAGQMFYFIAAGDNTGAVTLNIDSLGAKSVTRDGSVALAASDLKSGEVVVVVYDGTRFQVVSQLNSAGDARFANVSITSALNVGGVATFSAGTAAAPSITTSGDTNTGIFFPAADTIAFAEGGVEAARFDASGNLLVGTSTATNNLRINEKLAVVHAGSNTYAGIAITGYSGTASGARPIFDFNRSRGATDGSLTKVESGDSLGSVIFRGADGAAFQDAALISAEVDGATGANDMPGRLVFSTSADGLTSPTERMRLDSSGNLGLGVTPGAWGSTLRALQIGRDGAVSAGTTFSEIYLSGNARYDGSNWKYISTNPAAFYSVGETYHRWFIAGSGSAGGTISFTQAMTLDASGNLGIGTTSPANRLTVSGANTAARGQLSVVGASASPRITLYEDSTFYAAFAASGTDAYIGTESNTPFRFITNGTERARISSGGVFRVNTTTSSYSAANAIMDVNGGSTAAAVLTTSAGATYANLYCHNTATSGDNTFIDFGTEGTWTSRGSITYNRPGGVVAYNTTSDYRSKDVYGPIQNPGETIDALKIYRGKMKGATIERPMMIAHEAQEVVPYAVSGEKDAVNEDGTPKYQTMDHQILVPLLIAELQSLRKRVAELEAK